jgi:hypothetical protein
MYPQGSYGIISDLVGRKYVTIGGSANAREITLDLKKGDGSAFTSHKYRVIRWWISSSGYGAPVNMTGTHSFTINNGVLIDGSMLDDGNMKTVMTNIDGRFKFTITNSYYSGSTTYYFNVEHQGIVSSSTFTVYTTGAV